jgi:very-short-patch-repair endonuclease
MPLPELCYRCKKLKDAALGSWVKRAGRCHDRRWVCMHCQGKQEKAKLFDRGMDAKASPLEKQAAAAVAKTGHHFKTEYPLGSFRLDLVVPSLGLAIEVDSRRWHNSPARVRRDAIKTKLAEKAGFKLVRVRQPDIAAKVQAAVECREHEILP